MLRSTSAHYPLKRKVTIGTKDLTWVVLSAYYAFVFSIPFQTADIGTEKGFLSLASLTGYLFMMLTILKPRLCYKFPGKVFWLFVLYLLINLLIGIIVIVDSPRLDIYLSFIKYYFATFVQLLLLFWISSNLMRHDQTVRATLLTLAISCIVLAIGQTLGLTSELYRTKGRLTALGANPNTIGNTLSLGLLALVGLAYGRGEMNRRARAAFWLFSGFLLVAIVRTGSRGAIVALLAGLLVFMAKRAGLGLKVKLGLALILCVAALVIASYYIEPVRVRWEATFTKGDTAGRDVIYANAWDMFLERPVFGWGPAFLFELGSRLGLQTRDTHNLFLWLLDQGGLVGAMPFMGALFLCCRSAWRARKSIQGILPMAMLVCLLVTNMKGTGIHSKLLWLVLGYAAASGRYPPFNLRQRGQPFLHSQFQRSDPVDLTYADPGHRFNRSSGLR
jgi:O-antigen ligase